MKKEIPRREFLATSTLAGAGLALGFPSATLASSSPKPAKLGGPKARTQPYSDWPVFDETEEKALLSALRSGKWFRGTGKNVLAFEEAFSKLTGAPHCLATSSGTGALATAFGAMDLGPGDEVLLPPYTFVATFNCITMHFALPVFVDTDPETFQIDAAKIEPSITPYTRSILPVHIGGSPANLDKIIEVADRHKLPVVEDACQAHLAQWRGRSVGCFGLAGCFSFQASKNLTSGEGGALLTHDEAFADACYMYHYQGVGRRSRGGEHRASSSPRGANFRLSEFQASLLLAQMTRVAEQTKRRNENADYLTKLLSEIPGLRPAKQHEGTTRSAYHLYMFSYDPAHFADLTRAKFLDALNAEGVPSSGGYTPLNKSDLVQSLARNPHYLKVYGEQRMKDWCDQTHNLPQNDRVCDEAVWFTQNMLLGPRDDMDQIADAIRKIQAYGAELAKA